MEGRRGGKKYGIVATLGVTMILELVAFVALAVPAPVAALSLGVPTLYLGPGLPTAPIGLEQGQTQQSVKDTVKESVGQQLGVAVIQAILNAVMFFSQKIASDGAVWIASGGKGQAALIYKDGAGEYLKGVSLDTLGGVMGDVTAALKKTEGAIPGSISLKIPKLDLDLCAPSIKATLNIQVGLLNKYNPPTPRCSWSQISQNWSNFSQSVETGEILNQVGASFTPSQTPLGAALIINGKTTEILEKDKSDKALQYLAEHGWKPVTDAISGKIKTPSSVVEEKFHEEVQRYPGANNRAVFQAALLNKDVGYSMITSVLSTFVSTLANTLLNRVSTGFFSAGDLLPQNALLNIDLSPATGRADAERIYSSVVTAQVNSLDQYDLLGDFSNCPPQGAGPTNCVITDKFASAVRQASAGSALTVTEAISNHLIDDSLPLFPSSDTAKNQSEDCFTIGYCYTNLVKLRSALIIPIGWELAANSPYNQPGNPVSLHTVIAGFKDCNSEGTIDKDHPWCHLIDPDWILKYPLTQCRASVSGATALGSQRNQVCVDAPTCTSDDGNGTCLGTWGYCTRERNVWRFSGDVCPAQFNTCQTFNGGTDNHQLIVKTNTVDFGICNADNAGCSWYSTQPIHDLQCLGGVNKGKICTLDTECPGSSCFPVDRVCSAGPNVGARCTKDSECGGNSCVPNTQPPLVAVQNRIYLTAKAASCTATDAGCTELVPKNGVTLNLLHNPSFETNVDGVAGPDEWLGTPVTYSIDGTLSQDGQAAVVVDGGAGKLIQEVRVMGNQAYTISFGARRIPGVDPKDLSLSFVGIEAFKADRSIASLKGLYTNCVPPDDNQPNRIVYQTKDLTDQYVRNQCTFTTPTFAAYAVVTLTGTGIEAIDAVQLEQNESVTPYGSGYSGGNAQQRVYLKEPPKGLCTGGPNDPSACAGYATMCRQSDVGCEEYRPTNGDTPVPGVVNTVDQCPNACVGYATFREEPTNFNTAGSYPNYFIPGTAKSCNAQYAGCDEFTQLTKGTEAEARSYYTYLRLCETPKQNDDTGTFYTWEGSEKTGFQLRTWQLKTSNILDAAVNAIDPTGGIAPCTNYDGVNGTCKDTGPLVVPGTCKSRADIFGNPDCREFYDGAGKIHYRLYSKTVTKSAACVDFRKTESDEISCAGSGGRWQSATSQCFYHALVSENQSCPVEQNLCRSYTGNGANNVQTISALSNNFEGGNIGAFDTGTATISNESTANTGHSVAKKAGATITSYVANPSQYKDDSLLLSFWAKGTAGRTLEVKFGSAPVKNRYFSVADKDPVTPTGVLSSDWRAYTFGPVPIDWDAEKLSSTCTLPNNAACTVEGGCTCKNNVGVPQCAVANGQKTCTYDTLTITTATDDGSKSDAAAQLFVDTMVMKRVSDTVNVIRSSWKTPAQCDATSDGTFSPQAMLGCSEYRDRANNVVDAKSFTKLCSENAIGCRAFFDTHNSSSPYAQSSNYICVRPNKDAGACLADPDGAKGPQKATEVCTVAPGHDRCTFTWKGEVIDPVPNNTWSDPTLALPYIDSTVNGNITLPFFYGSDLTIVPDDSPVYLVDTQEKRCKAEVRGCQAVDLPTLDATKTVVKKYNTVYRMNLPDTYPQTLCGEEALYCAAWKTDTGTQSYFKDPQTKTCEYKESSGANASFGWFKTGGTEPCYENFQIGAKENGIWTNQSVCTLSEACADPNGCTCPGGVGVPSKCTVTNGQTTCSPFDGWAGTCKQDVSSCSEFLDPHNKGTNDLKQSQWPDGKPYDYLRNDKLRDDLKLPSEQCLGLVSIREGCGLFNDTANSVLRWNAGATYLKSDTAGFAKVAPVDCENPTSDDWKYCTKDIITGQYCVRQNPDNKTCVASIKFNDANQVLKVQRDRECAEWLACSSPQPVFDPRQGKVITACSSLDLCNAPSPIKNTSSCTYVLDKPTPTIINADSYAKRDISWFGEDYSGYSIPGVYPVDALQSVNVGACMPASYTGNSLAIPEAGLIRDKDYKDLRACNSENDCDMVLKEKCVPHSRLGRVLGPCQIPPLDKDKKPTKPPGYACDVYQCLDSKKNVTNSTCFVDSDCPNTEKCSNGQNGTAKQLVGSGSCFQNLCVQPPNGAVIDTNKQPIPLLTQSAPASCRAYPEAESPFPNSVVTSWTDPTGKDADPNNLQQIYLPKELKKGFETVSTCSGGESCECSYRKISFGNTSRYFSMSSAIPFEGKGICTSGPKNGQICKDDDECTVFRVPKDPKDPPQIIGVPGTCEKLSRTDQVVGQPGFCLQYDTSRPINGTQDKFACLLWYPIDQISGFDSLYNQFAGAGWDANEKPDQQWYCANGDKVPVGDPAYQPQKKNDPNDPAYGMQGPKLTISYTDGRGSEVKGLNILNTPGGKNGGSNYFGEPDYSHTDCKKDPKDCVSAPDLNPDAVPYKNCQYSNEQGAWCLWPQRLCKQGLADQNGFCPSQYKDDNPSFRGDENAGGIGPNNDRGVIKWHDTHVGPAANECALIPLPGFVMGYQSPTENSIRNDSLNPDVLEPEHGANFFGCYELADSTGQNMQDIHYPWVGPPVYSWQIEKFEIMLRDSDQPCRVFTGENSGTTEVQPDSHGVNTCQSAGNDSTFGDNKGQAVPFGPAVKIAEKPTDSVLQSIDSALNFSPIYDESSKLVSIAIQAWDEKDEFSFFIDSFTIRFWPSCYRVAHVGDSGNAAYTDRLQNDKPADGWKYPQPAKPVLSVEKQTPSTPWGAICKYDETGLKLVTNNLTDPGNASCDFLGLFREEQGQGGDFRLRQLFARSNAVSEFAGGGGSCSYDGGKTTTGKTCQNQGDCAYAGSCGLGLECKGGVKDRATCAADVECQIPLTPECKQGPKIKSCLMCNGNYCTPPDGGSIKCDNNGDCKGLKNDATTKSTCGATAGQCVGNNLPPAIQGKACAQDVDCKSGATTVCVNAAKQFSPDPAKFVYNSASQSKWDETETADGGAAKAPEVHPLGSPNTDGTYNEDVTRDGMTVNNQSSGDVGGGTRQLRAFVQFYMHADNNRMPIKNLAIDWGDHSNRYDQSGNYKNYREPKAGTTECDATKGWGYTSGACVGQPVSISHDYKCSQAILDSLPGCENGLPNPVTGYSGSGYGGCNDTGSCVYVPRISIEDNWGWCSSEKGSGCPGGRGGDGCYDAFKNQVKPAPSECLTSNPNKNTNANPWDYFDGRIIVKP